MPETLLLTGGAGYIGSHTALTLLRQGYDVVVIEIGRASCRERV